MSQGEVGRRLALAVRDEDASLLPSLLDIPQCREKAERVLERMSDAGAFAHKKRSFGKEVPKCIPDEHNPIFVEENSPHDDTDTYWNSSDFSSCSTAASSDSDENGFTLI
jgi:hypothetical protein